MVAMHGGSVLCVALSLAGCDSVFGLDREVVPYGDGSVYSTFEADLDRAGIPDLVVLDRTPDAARFHVVFGDLGEQFGSRVATTPLSFRPLAFALVVIGSDPVPSAIVVGERGDGAGALAILRQRNTTQFDPAIEFAFAERLEAISAITVVRAATNTFVLGLVAGGRVLITVPFTLNEPTIVLTELERGVSKTAAVLRTPASLWVIDDDHASEITIDTNGVAGELKRQDWPSTPSDRRVVSTSGSFSVVGDVHGFSTRCDDAACTLTWHAISRTRPPGIDVRVIDYAAVTQLIIGELGAGDNGADVGMFGVQSDGDALATLRLDHTYDGRTFRTFGDWVVFPRTSCPDLSEAVGMTTARLTAGDAARTLILLDRDGRGQGIRQDGACATIALQLP